MKSDSFFCPYDSVFKILQIIVERKGYVIASANADEGRIRSYSKKSLFKKPKTLDIKIFKLDQHATGMTLMVNDNSSVFDKPLYPDEYEEERLSNSINRYF
jgi:hypothetical protein